MIGVPASDIIPMSISSIRYESIFWRPHFHCAHEMFE